MSMPLMLYLRHDVPRATGTPCGGSQQDKPPPLGSTGSSEFFTVLVLRTKQGSWSCSLSGRLTPMPSLFHK